MDNINVTPSVIDVGAEKQKPTNAKKKSAAKSKKLLGQKNKKVKETQ